MDLRSECVLQKMNRQNDVATQKHVAILIFMCVYLLPAQGYLNGFVLQSLQNILQWNALI